MSENSTYTDLLIQYLDGELSGEQLERLKKDMAENISLRDEYENLKMARESMKSYGLKNRVHTIHTEMMAELKTKPATEHESVRNIFPMAFRIAATVIVLAGLSALYQYLTATPEKLFIENFQSYSIRQTRAGVENDLEKTYKTGNAEAVVQQFSLIKEPGATDYFLAGNAWLILPDPPKAIEAFTNLQELNKTHNTHFFEEDTEYYLALSYLANEEAGKALPILEKIHADPNHPYHKKVSAWFISRVRHISTH